ncbi:GNAT family N-acetyltransferase [Ensifer soli]|uniref:GNAT family N-acetyltransferase n=1 Tax=Ciceribacter sp. sgz301302 TaxID=3342379 RepID=UPI0035B9C431
MTQTIVSTRERPDLAPVTGTWRWKAFFEGGPTGLDEILARDAACTRVTERMPTVLVLLEDGAPVAMAALCRDDLPQRPALNPWLAGVYVDHPHRGKGHARTIVAAVEALARDAGIAELFLYTPDAEGLYARLGWTERETLPRGAEILTVMSKRL